MGNKHSRLWIVALLVMVALVLAACGNAPDATTQDEAGQENAGPAIVISNAWARPAAAMMGADEGEAEVEATEEAGDGESSMDMGSVSAVYMVIENQGDTADRLVSVQADPDLVGVTELHQTTVNDQGVAQMRPVTDGLEIPAGGSVTLEPGSYHVMLMDLQGDLVEGETLSVTLTFESGETITLEALIGMPEES